MEIPPPPEPAPEAIPPAVPPNKEERLWAMTAHLSAFVGYFFPFGNILGPLVVWIAKRDTSEFVEDQARESLNAQISVTIYLAVAAVLFLIIIGIPIQGDSHIASALARPAAITTPSGTSSAL